MEIEFMTTFSGHPCTGRATYGVSHERREVYAQSAHIDAQPLPNGKTLGDQLIVLSERHSGAWPKRASAAAIAAIRTAAPADYTLIID